MIRIGITLDDVIRAKTAQIGKIYKKYINKNLNVESLDLSTIDYSKVFNFKSKTDYNKFLYEDYAFEIFAEAGMMTPSLDKKLNLWHLSLNDNEEIDEEIELILMNPMEFNASIGYTHFFLSKIATKVRETYFPAQTNNIWDKCDILITADPRLINDVPSNKVCVKINNEYNKCLVNNDGLSFDSLEEFINDKDNLLTVVKKYFKKNE